jgi:hypothetical protein
LAALKWTGAALSAAVFGLYIGTLFYEANVTLALVGFFLMQGALYELKDNLYTKALSDTHRRKKLQSGMGGRTVYVSETMTLFRLLRLLNHNYYYTVVMTDGEGNELRAVKQRELNELFLKNNLHAPLKDCFSTRCVVQ